MNLTILGKGMEVSDYLRGTVEKKARKLERYFMPDTKVNVALSIEHSRHICEVTVYMPGVLLRTEEVSGDMYNSIDASLKKLERQIRKHRTKLEKRLHEDAFVSEAPIYEQDSENYSDAELVRRKHFPVKPMDIEEAKMQMELLGHSFFVFMSSESGHVNVLYKRNDGTLGLLEPDYE